MPTVLAKALPSLKVGNTPSSQRYGLRRTTASFREWKDKPGAPRQGSMKSCGWPREDEVPSSHRCWRDISAYASLTPESILRKTLQKRIASATKTKVDNPHFLALGWQTFATLSKDNSLHYCPYIFPFLRVGTVVIWEDCKTVQTAASPQIRYLGVHITPVCQMNYFNRLSRAACHIL